MSIEITAEEAEAGTYRHSGMSPKQAKLFTTLVKERVPEITLEAWRTIYRNVSCPADASKAIDVLLSLPVKGGAVPTRSGIVVPADLPELETAHYALSDGNGGFKFYKVSRPVEGKWAGRVFVDAQASDDYHPVRNVESVNEVLSQIAAVPQRAAVDYGMQIGQCFKCHRSLTKTESRERGMGKDCAGKMGW